jgi:predicted lipoprotein with Yx(FWY)xxD motif
MNDRTPAQDTEAAAHLSRKTAVAVAIGSFFGVLALVAFAATDARGAAPASGSAAASMAPATVAVRSSRFGKVLFDGRNRVLYAFTKDPRGKSVCYSSCATAWPPYIVKGTLHAGTGASAALLGKTKRRDGRMQLTYAGRPLYYYVHDGAGEILCQDVEEFGGTWLIVRGSGKLVR